MGQGPLSGTVSTTRRTLLAAAAALPFAGCRPRVEQPTYAGGWVGHAHERGHRLRDTRSGALPAPSVVRRAAVVVVGGGVAGLACARTLARSGVDDVQLLELEDHAGGNSRAHRIAGIACPLGAHYLPVPGPQAGEVAALLEDLGVRRVVHGRPVYDERHLCHSPQERLYLDGAWHPGLLPPPEALPAAERTATVAQYRRFAALVREAQAQDAYAVPTGRASWHAGLDALDAQTFAQWLDAHGLQAPALRWYLDYCCRDDYGGGAAEVSAWAGLHYFASRHGFDAGDAEDEGDEPVLTWPEGNAWLVKRMAEPLRERLHAGRVALRVDATRHGVAVDAWNAADGRIERWEAAQVVLATPLFVAQRLLVTAVPALAEAAARVRSAPWLVANLHLDAPLDDTSFGAPPAWDNVVFGGPGLGYVDAMHQSLRPHPGPTVLTAYWSWGADPAHRRALLEVGWPQRAAQVVQSLSAPHPDLVTKLRQVDLMRYGHAMSLPAPGVRSHPALRALAQAPHGRVHFAHADLSAYSVFEEAYTHGVRAAHQVRQALRA